MTLIEILIVVAIIAILIAVIGLVGQQVKEKGKKELTRSIMDSVMSAVDEYKVAAGNWPPPPNAPNRTAWNQPPPAPTTTDIIPYEPGEPLDLGHLNDRTFDDFYLGDTPPSYHPPFEMPPATSPVYIGDKTIRSIEGLWLCLNAPTSGNAVDTDARAKIAAILGRLPESAKLNGHPGQLYRRHLNVPPDFIDAMQILDAWGHPLRFRWYQYRNNNRPFLWSAGPDGQFSYDPNRPGDPVADPRGLGNDDIFSDRKD